MDKTKLLAFLREKFPTGKGCQWVKVVLDRPVKVKKGGPEIRKVTMGTFALGATYAPDPAKGTGSILRAMERSGADPEEWTPDPLPWGEWEHFPYTIIHKGESYIRLTANYQTLPPVVFYRLADGKEVTKEWVKEFALASEFREHYSEKQAEAGIEDALQVRPFTINVSHVVSLG